MPASRGHSSSKSSQIPTQLSAATGTGQSSSDRSSAGMICVSTPEMWTLSPGNRPSLLPSVQLSASHGSGSSYKGGRSRRSRRHLVTTGLSVPPGLGPPLPIPLSPPQASPGQGWGGCSEPRTPLGFLSILPQCLPLPSPPPSPSPFSLHLSLPPTLSPPS